MYCRSALKGTCITRFSAVFLDDGCCIWSWQGRCKNGSSLYTWTGRFVSNMYLLANCFCKETCLLKKKVHIDESISTKCTHMKDLLVNPCNFIKKILCLHWQVKLLFMIGGHRIGLPCSREHTCDRPKQAVGFRIVINQVACKSWMYNTM